MSTAALFERLAPRYDELWTDTPVGRAQRNAVWRVVDELFHAGDRVLDIGCGTGEDAAHLAARGVIVHAVDASPAMVAQASARGGFTVGRAIVPADLLCLCQSRTWWGHASACPGEHRSPVKEAFSPTSRSSYVAQPRPRNSSRVETATPNEPRPHSRFGEQGSGAFPSPFDAALSNFGVLNCIADLRPVSLALAPLIRPGGHLAICTMGRFCAWEMLYPKRAFRRWPGRAGEIYYPTVRQLRAAFAPNFDLLRWTGIGKLVPPSYVKLPARIVRALERIDRFAPLRFCADHRLLVFRRK